MDIAEILKHKNIVSVDTEITRAEAELLNYLRNNSFHALNQRVVFDLAAKYSSSYHLRVKRIAKLVDELGKKGDLDG